MVFTKHKRKNHARVKKAQNQALRSFIFFNSRHFSSEKKIPERKFAVGYCKLALFRWRYLASANI
jgi:hypothetical protein